jgi:hypothetical protein
MYPSLRDQLAGLRSTLLAMTGVHGQPNARRLINT